MFPGQVLKIKEKDGSKKTSKAANMTTASEIKPAVSSANSSIPDELF